MAPAVPAEGHLEMSVREHPLESLFKIKTVTLGPVRAGCHRGILIQAISPGCVSSNRSVCLLSHVIDPSAATKKNAKSLLLIERLHLTEH